MKLLCLETCFIKRLYNETEVYDVDAAKAKELLESPHFEKLDGPPPPKVEEEQLPGQRKKITVK